MEPRTHIRRATRFFAVGLALAFITAIVGFASAATIEVPDDYATIQGAIDASSPGDTILVHTGTYYESLSITKTLRIRGDDRSGVVIDAGGAQSCVTVSGTSGVRFCGFTLRGASSDGVYVSSSPYTAICDCEVVSNGGDGIRLVSSDFSCISDCYLHANSGNGVTITAHSDNVSVEFCNSSENGQGGIGSWEWPSNLEIAHCYCVDNTGNGIEPHWATSGTIHDCTVIGNNYGMTFDGTYGVTVENCTLSGNNRGVHITYGAHDNIVRDCLIEWNTYGVDINNSGPTVYGHKFYHNAFTHNTVQVSEWTGTGAENQTWDDGYPSGGNTWDDYVGHDQCCGADQNLPGPDGIGDTPYAVTDLASDNYPFYIAPCPVQCVNWGGIKALFR